MELPRFAIHPEKPTTSGADGLAVIYLLELTEEAIRALAQLRVQKVGIVCCERDVKQDMRQVERND